MDNQAAPASAKSGDCIPGSGWTWVDGPLEPALGQQVADELTQQGISADVEASSYGERDSCGSYLPQGMDYKVKIKESGKHLGAEKKAVLLNSLKKNTKSKLGNILLIHGDGAREKLKSPDQEAVPSAATSPSSLAASPSIVESSLQTNTTTLTPATLSRKVLVIVFNPVLKNGQTLVEYMSWSDPNVLKQYAVDFFNTASHGQLQYQVVETVNRNEWPEKTDGFRYTESTYLAVMNHTAVAHSPDNLNYNKVINSDLDICGRVNRGEIDEVWVYGAPYFGFWESTLLGPGAYTYNSSPVPQPWLCSRLIPIMGLSYERWYSEEIESFGHRAEATMTRTYRGWEENRTDHNWDRFGLDKAQSPNYGYSGCGSIHYAPNSIRDYDWSNPSSVSSYCQDFDGYPDLPSPPNLQSVNCSTWGCDGPGFFGWWYGHMPHSPGCGPDNVANQWWVYIATPALANNPKDGCPIPPANLTGQITLQGRPARPAPSWSVPLSVRLDPVIAGQPDYTFNLTSDSNGAFSLADTQPGTYTLRVKHTSGLAVSQQVTLVSGANSLDLGLLPEGDVNDDNAVNSADLTNLQAAYSRCSADSGYSLAADLNEDGCVTLLDFSLLASNYGKCGDLPGGTVVPPQPGTNSSVQMTVSPAESKVQVGERFEVSILLRTGDRSVDGAQVSLNFDPAKLKIVNVQANSTGFPLVLLNRVDNALGRLDFAGGALDHFPSGSIELARVELEALAEAPSTGLTFQYALPRGSAVTYQGSLLLTSGEAAKVESVPLYHLYMPALWVVK